MWHSKNKLIFALSTYVSNSNFFSLFRTDFFFGAQHFLYCENFRGSFKLLIFFISPSHSLAFDSVSQSARRKIEIITDIKTKSKRERVTGCVCYLILYFNEKSLFRILYSFHIWCNSSAAIVHWLDEWRKKKHYEIQHIFVFLFFRDLEMQNSAW